MTHAVDRIDGRTALIGYTGFVGSNIARRHDFDDTYNTSNLHEIEGREYALVVSAAGRADSHRINQAPDEDRAELDAYATTLSTVSIGRLVHVSTVCVYDGDTERCDENTVSDPSTLTPYGANRLHLERTLSERFDTLSLRLPQLFGPGIKKGLVYDLANDYRVEFIDPDGVFQYYDLTRSWDDIGVALDAGLHTLNVATEPLGHRRLAEEVFGTDISGNDVEASPFAAMYTRDMTSVHAELFGGSDGYLMSAEEEMAAIESFVDQLRPGDDDPASEQAGEDMESDPTSKATS